jgi:putative flippase GtrA
VGILNTEVRVLRLRKIQDILSGMWVFKKEIRDDLALTAGDWNLSPQIKINAATNPRIRFAEYNIVQHKRLGESHQHYFKTGFNHLTWIFKDWLASIPSFLKRLFVQPTTNGAVQFFRYGFVALVAFVFDFGLLGVFTEKLHWFYLLSATSSFTISVVVNYMLSTAWVFSQRTKRQRSVELALFIGICLIALLLNDAFMWIFTSGLGIHYMVSKLITVTLVFFWSFGARRVVFQTKLGNAKWLRKIRATLGRAEESTNV